MRKKPGGAGGRGRTWAPAKASCSVCNDQKKLTMVTDGEDLPVIVSCPHCGPPYLAISTYYQQGKP